MNKNNKNTFDDIDKQKAVDKLKGDFSTKNFTKIAEKTGCTIITLRKWATALSEYTPRKQKPIAKRSKKHQEKVFKPKILSPKKAELYSIKMKQLESLYTIIEKQEAELQELQVTLDTKKKEYLRKQTEIQRNLGM